MTETIICPEERSRLNAGVAATRSATLTVLGLALVLRLLVVWNVITHYPHGWLFTRGMEMGLLAKSFLAGQGLASPFGVPTGPTAFIAPGYPLLIAGIFRVFGIESTTSAIVVMLMQSALNLATIVLMMHLARTLRSQRAAWIAGLIWAVSPPLVFLPTIFWDTSFSIFVVTAMLVLALRLRGQMTVRAWAAMGAFCGVAALLTPALVFVLAAMMGWLVWQARGYRARSLVALVVFAVLFAPWPIRNYRVFHAFVPLRTTVGYELWMGNREGATGFYEESLFPSFNAPELADYKARGEIGYTNHKAELARAYIRVHPATFLRLTAVRMTRFWRGTGAKGGSALFALHATLTTLFGWAGLWMLYRRGPRNAAILFTLPLLVFPMPYYITHAEFRYRLIVDPLLTVLAAGAIAALWSRLSVEAANPSDEAGVAHE